ncbi:MAG: indole-3-glycerol phosphate synthase TrpC [Armatimonadetes bacterium]|nr:indole-3-glycerol phosphate synthase TrpC [Armatimonadota bacterium]NIO99027.1 indole-3-glycerol phosphate synthase TrpC [Armatimonadota bacterium]
MPLEEILAYKRKEIEGLKGSPELSAPPPVPTFKRRGFAAALRSSGEIRLIAEIKRRSPSRGNLRPDLDPAQLASSYQEAGASAISVLTDEHFFGGSLADLRGARTAVTLPVLRKDFILDETQIWQVAGENGADALLLIVAALSEERLKALLAEAGRYGLDCLVEVHSEEEVDVALRADAETIGINNRNLKTFDIDLKTTARLRSLIPSGKVVVSESGIHSREDVAWLQGLEIDAILVGETLMQSPDPAAKIRELLGK